MINSKRKILFFYSLFIISYLYPAQGASNCLDAITNYNFLIKDSLENPFTMSVGTSMSQTHVTDNTTNPRFIRKKLYEISQKKGKEKAKSWLKAKNVYWYLLRSMPKYGCINGHEIHAGQIADEIIVNKLLDDIVNHLDDNDFILTQCPICDSDKIGIVKEEEDLFDEVMENKLVGLIKNLGVDLQIENGLPNARLSIEISDILKIGTTEVDENKLDRMVKFINKIGNPMLFFHHYANPRVLSNLFEEQKDIFWFSDICTKIIAKLPNITHVCPISQPIGFVFRVTREDLPPFEYNKKRDEIVENMIKACAQASIEMKNVRLSQGGKKLNVLISHQWKIMKAKHKNITDIRYAIELLVTTIADNKYNGLFVKHVKPYIDKFDGIALSVYPALQFDMWKAEGSNIGGDIDYEGSIDAVVETSKAFPGKDIYIVEAGCNTDDSGLKKKYIDMMICVCKRARDAAIPVKALYFWGITNHSDFYMEWNSRKGSTYFGAYDTMELSSINASGEYIQKILKQNLILDEEDANVLFSRARISNFLLKPKKKSYKKIIKNK
jgi:hypothetical protein